MIKGYWDLSVFGFHSRASFWASGTGGLTENGCVSSAFYEEYDALNVEEATDKLFAPENEGILARYRIHTEEIASPYRWNVSWPLFRRGSEKGIVKRGKRQGAVPWYWYDDDTLFEIWNKPLDSYGFKTRFMLTVGGRTKEEAVENWHLLVKPLRKRFKEVRSNPSSLLFVGEGPLKHL